MALEKPKLGPPFSCRLTEPQHEYVEGKIQESGASYAEVVRRLVERARKREAAKLEKAGKGASPKRAKN